MLATHIEANSHNIAHTHKTEARAQQRKQRQKVLQARENARPKIEYKHTTTTRSNGMECQAVNFIQTTHDQDITQVNPERDRHLTIPQQGTQQH